MACNDDKAIEASGFKTECKTANIMLEIAKKKEYEAERAAESDKLLRATAFLGVSAGMYFGSENLATVDKQGFDC